MVKNSESKVLLLESKPYFVSKYTGLDQKITPKIRGKIIKTLDNKGIHAKPSLL